MVWPLLFWNDNWAETNTPLINLIPGYEELVDKNAKVVELHVIEN